MAPFAFCLFFSILVAYTFLYWLPFYIRHTGKTLSLSMILMSDCLINWIDTFLALGSCETWNVVCGTRKLRLIIIEENKKKKFIGWSCEVHNFLIVERASKVVSNRSLIVDGLEIK